MPKNVKLLMRRIATNYENYKSLVGEELYEAHKKEQFPLNKDQLDYLMCCALCSMPEYEFKINDKSSFIEVCLFFLRNLINAKDAPDPQFEIIVQVVEKHKTLDICNDWHKSVLFIYDLIVLKTLACIKEDLKRLTSVVEEKEQEQQQLTTVNYASILLFSGAAAAATIHKAETKQKLETHDSNDETNNVLKEFSALVL